MLRCVFCFVRYLIIICFAPYRWNKAYYIYYIMDTVMLYASAMDIPAWIYRESRLAKVNAFLFGKLWQPQVCICFGKSIFWRERDALLSFRLSADCQGGKWALGSGWWVLVFQPRFLDTLPFTRRYFSLACCVQLIPLQNESPLSH